MVKLYYTPTSCAASSFISAHIAKLNFDCEVVDLATHTTESGIDFYSINPKGNVPTIVLDDGTILNENISCLLYIADQSTDFELAPEKNSNQRYVLIQILSFLTSELHSIIGMFFNPITRENKSIRIFLMNILNKKMKYLEKNVLSDINNKFVYNNQFTIIDAYLHIILSWFGYVGIDINEYPIACRYFMNISELEYVKKAKHRMSVFPNRICN